MTKNVAPDDNEFSCFLEDRKGCDLDTDDVVYMHEHFVTAEVGSDRHKEMMAVVERNTTAFNEATKAFHDQHTRICVLEEDKKRKRWLIPVMITGITLIVLLLSKLPGIAMILKSFTPVPK